MKRTYWLSGVLCLSSYTLAAEEISPDLEISGFGRIVAGYLNDENAAYEGYEDSISVSQQSLVALQADYAITDTLSLTGQLLGHTADGRDSGLEWLYINYQPDQHWGIKAGRLRTPFFRYSEIIDVGFAYPWITPPQQLYSGNLFTNYDGVNISYKHAFEPFQLTLDVYTGRSEEDVNIAGQEAVFDIGQITGVIAQIQRNNLQLRASFSEAKDIGVDIPEFQAFRDILRNAGFGANADALRFNGNGRGYLLGLNYDSVDFFGAAEFIRIRSNIQTVPHTDSYYLSLGYNFYPFQVYAVFATSDSEYGISDNQIPLGVNPVFDQLHFGYDAIVNELPLDNLDSYSIGGRWDFAENRAFKAEVSWLDGEPTRRSYFDVFNDSDFDRQAVLYQVAFEWVF